MADTPIENLEQALSSLLMLWNGRSLYFAYKIKMNPISTIHS
jgi:hypothetical protein